MRTEKGHKLRMRLIEYRYLPEDLPWDEWPDLETCSLLCYHGARYNTIQERWCNEQMSDVAEAALRTREGRIEATMTKLVATLPQPPAGDWKLRFDGDPRGPTSRLIHPDRREVMLG